MRINKYLCGLAVGFSMLFAACDTDNIGAQYNGNDAGQGITFAASKLAATAVKASDPKFQVPIYRSDKTSMPAASMSALNCSGSTP